MSKENLHIDELLVKQLLGEATVEEQGEVTAWINESEANKIHYQHLQRIWVDSKQLAVNSTVDETEAWERFQQRITQAETSQPKTIELAPTRMNWMRVAAILLVLLGAGWMMKELVWKSESVYAASDAATMVQNLPDGTIVTLNKNSSIKYSDAGSTRKLTLKGEAFFDVAPDKNKPFIITANDAEIKVVGTSFNVKSSGDKTEVIVETGIVEVSKKENMVKLMPKEKATVLQSKETPLKDKVEDVLYNYYRTKELVCDNTPLWRLVDVLNDAYNANIVIADSRLKNLPITTTFKNETLEQILETISGTFHINVEKNGKDIILR